MSLHYSPVLDFHKASRTGSRREAPSLRRSIALPNAVRAFFPYKGPTVFGPHRPRPHHPARPTPPLRPAPPPPRAPPTPTGQKPSTAEPQKPVVPTKPTDPEKPSTTVPEKPVDPNKPVDSEKPSTTEPEKPVDPNKPIDPEKPSTTESEKPVYPNKPVDPEKPSTTKPEKPVDPEKPSPTEPEKPVDPSKPLDLEKPVDLNKPVEPEKPSTTEQEKPVDPNKPVDPEKPSTTEPEKPIDPNKPVDPEKPSTTEPEKPVDPNKPVEPEKPSTTEPEKPIEPNKPVDPEKPSTTDPNKPVDPNKPLDPEKPSTTEPEKPVDPEKPSTTEPGKPTNQNNPGNAEKPSTTEPEKPVYPNKPTDPNKPPITTPVQPGVRRSSFPSGFRFGASTSAFQIEGSTNVGGRGPSIWDTFAQQRPDKIFDKTVPDVACDSYNRYKDDVKLINEAGMDSYRFSISWPRILPKGTLGGGLNKAGIIYYNNLINELLANGITPFATLFHWDVPQALEDEYGGFRDKRIVEDFTDFSDMCFMLFGDRVKHWITENEPFMFSTVGYDTGSGAPGRCSPSLGCPAGDSSTEPYIVSHNLLLAHAAVVKLYRDQYQDAQKGEIGITLVVNWTKPYSQSKEDISANGRSQDFSLGWYIDPIVYGDYPFIMKALVGDRLPAFTEEESKLLKGSYDFIGMNYYFTSYANDLPYANNTSGSSYNKDSFVGLLGTKEGVPIGEKVRDEVFYSCPDGMLDLLLYVKKNYKNPTIYITENGVPDSDNNQLSFEEALNDKERIKYYDDHLTKLQEAIRYGVDVKGYFAWSLMDNWEWVFGYTKRFGLAYVDYDDKQNRYQKDSFKWFTKVLKT